MKNDEALPLHAMIERIDPLFSTLRSLRTIEERLLFLQAAGKKRVCLTQKAVERLYQESSPLQQLILEELFVIDENSPPFVVKDQSLDELRSLVDQLEPLEDIFFEEGGLIAYHLLSLKLLVKKNSPSSTNVHYEPPPTYSPSNFGSLAIDLLPQLAEIYPVGGAGDRLAFVDSEQRSLPAALYPFNGRTLLEGMIRDLEAREYLYFKLNHRTIVTPIILMLSDEKLGATKILQLLEENHFFGRGREHFHYLKQPLVPLIGLDGHWCYETAFKLHMKPGGHGILWLLMERQGGFSFLKEHGRSHAIIRQINNPLAGCEGLLLTFAAIGILEKKSFGFVGCEREIGRAEGLLALRKLNDIVSITNVEYTDPTLQADLDRSNGLFPANTNLLFCSLNEAQQAARHLPLPGVLINPKTKVLALNPDGLSQERQCGRLESSMQNLADGFPAHHPDNLLSFVLLSSRAHSFSPAKQKSAKPSFQDAPERAFYDLVLVNREILQECGFLLPPIKSLEEFLEKPHLLFLFHPALGPQRSIISQKIQGGKLAEGSELHLELAEGYFVNLEIQGSCRIEALHHHREKENPSSSRIPQGRCSLIDVRIENRGIDYATGGSFWLQQFNHDESFSLSIEGSGEFYAEKVIFRGNYAIEVRDGERVVAYMSEDGTVAFSCTRVEQPSWEWSYEKESEGKITLRRISEIDSSMIHR